MCREETKKTAVVTMADGGDADEVAGGAGAAVFGDSAKSVSTRARCLLDAIGSALAVYSDVCGRHCTFFDSLHASAAESKCCVAAIKRGPTIRFCLSWMVTLC